MGRKGNWGEKRLEIGGEGEREWKAQGVLEWVKRVGEGLGKRDTKGFKNNTIDLEESVGKDVKRYGRSLGEVLKGLGCREVSG